MPISRGALRRAFQSGRGIDKALGAFNDTEENKGVGAIVDAAKAINASTGEYFQRANTPLTANRAITFTNPTVGDSFHITRTAAATGAFDLTVAGKVLAAGTWAIVAYHGTAWYVAAAGSL